MDRPLRIWVPGCSTGEETYSIAMLFLEEIAAAKRNIKLQVFASDIDDDASPLPATAPIRNRSRPMCRRRGSPASSSRRTRAIG